TGRRTGGDGGDGAANARRGGARPVAGGIPAGRGTPHGGTRSRGDRPTHRAVETDGGADPPGVPRHTQGVATRNGFPLAGPAPGAGPRDEACPHDDSFGRPVSI